MNALDTAISLVIIILLLSLIVQSVQAALKKLLKIKSRQLEGSLLDLFEHTLTTTPPGDAGAKTQPDGNSGAKQQRQSTRFRRSPVLRLVSFGGAVQSSDKRVRRLYAAVLGEFSRLGRVAQSGRLMLDSLAKEDLLKVLGRVAPDLLVPADALAGGIRSACGQIGVLRAALGSVAKRSLPGSSNADFAAIQALLTPALGSLEAICKDGTLRPDLILDDISSLRDLQLDQVLVLLGRVQDKVRQETPSGGQPQELSALTKALQDAASGLTALAKAYDEALAPLRARLQHVEHWYDTVMQSFEERYSRSMKTWALVISAIVVVLLNANFLKLHDRVSRSAVLRAALVESRADITARLTREGGGAATASDAAAVLAQIKDELATNAQLYTTYGFEPLNVEQAKWWRDTWGKSKRAAFGHDVRVIVGWMITVALLSVGAPFWQDLLESLFGVKNLLRRRGDIKNIEQQSGAGQPKP